MSHKYKVLVTHPEIPEAALNLLKEKCVVTICMSTSPRRAEILEKCAGMDGIFWGTDDNLDAEALDAAGPSLKAISIMSSRADYVDIPEVKNRRIKIGHTPDVGSEAAGDMAIGLMIAAARRFYEGRRIIETSTWQPWHLNWMLGKDIADSTVGFIGFGGTAQATARRLKGFKVLRIIYYSRKLCKNEEEFGAYHVQFDELLALSDFIFIMCPLTDDTRGMINEEVFNKMKPGCVLINTGRGEIVNQPDLYNALKSGQLFAAGLDAMDPEPLPNDDPLLSLPNCVLVPHLGSATIKTREQLAIVAVQNILNGLKNSKMLYPLY